MQTLLPMLCSLLAFGLAADARWLSVAAALTGGAGLLAGYRARRAPRPVVPQENTANAARAVLFLLVAWLFYDSYSGENVSAPETLLAWGLARMAAGEWAIRCWMREGFGPGKRIFRVLLPGIVLMGATNTYETDFVRWLVPLWFAMILLSTIEPERSHPGRVVPRSSLVFRALSITCVIVAGLGSHAMVSIYRFQLNMIGARLLSNHNAGEPSGLSTQPRLGATFGSGGSLTRVLRIQNWPAQRSYLRAMSFDTYKAGAWLPTPGSKKYFPVSAKWLHTDARGETAHVQRLVNDEGMLVVPLEATGVKLSNDIVTPLEWSPGGPLRSDDNAPDPFSYDIVLLPSSKGEAAANGPMAQKPTADELQKLQSVPEEMPLEVHLLAQQIGGAEVDPRAQIKAVEEYLMSHHSYSLTTDPGSGDPVANFVGSDKAAHCEYFASAAVMLLRCLGIPTRYCIGYYVHEKDGNSTIVRFRDAHAWAESYIAGPGGGWVTVEATPGGARPDNQGEPIPFWQKLREHVQDAVAAIRAAVLSLSKTPPLVRAVLFLAALLATTGATIRFALKARAAKTTGPSYVARSRELDAIARRFERWLKRRTKKAEHAPSPQGPPPVLTWRESLSAAVLEEDANAREWLRLYETARFSREPGDTARLRMLLQKLEKTPSEKTIQGEPHETTGNHHAHR